MRLIKVFIVITLLLSCENEGKKSSLKLNNKISEVKEYGIRNSFIHPSEIIFNDLVISIDYQNGVSGAEVLNQYILKNGNQKVKIKVYHMFSERGKFFESILSLNEDLAIHEYQTDGNDIFDMKIIKKLDFPEIEQPVPFIEYEWEFEAELPFELEGWKNSENLVNWDTEVLEKKVLDKFTELRELLNKGNGAGFVKELDFANKEFFTANYFLEKQKQEYTANLIATYSEHKGIMPVIENYRVRIMGDGKVVTLENLGKYKGQSVLTAENKEKDVLYLNYVMLHKPKNSDDFKIVRINSQMTSID